MAKKLRVFQCHFCNRQAIVPSGYCPKCRSKDSYKAVDVDIKGQILSYTVVHVCEEKFQGEAPYLLAVIETNEGMRLLGRLAKPWKEPVEIGTNVELIEVIDDTYVFGQTDSDS